MDHLSTQANFNDRPVDNALFHVEACYVSLTCHFTVAPIWHPYPAPVLSLTVSAARHCLDSGSHRARHHMAYHAWLVTLARSRDTQTSSRVPDSAWLFRTRRRSWFAGDIAYR
jgi:hypothetical protein